MMQNQRTTTMKVPIGASEAEIQKEPVALKRKHITDTVNEAMEAVAALDDIHYSLIEADPDAMANFRNEVERTVEEVFVTVNNVRAKGGEIFSIDEALPHLSHDRKELIRTSLRNQSFVMSIVEKGDSQKVMITKDGEKFMPIIALSSSSGLQIASIVIESVSLVLNAVGIRIPSNPKGIQKAIEIANKAFAAGSTISKCIKDLKLSKDKGDTKGMAKAILKMVIDLFKHGYFMKIARALLSEMKWYDWLLTAAKLAAFITAMVATGGIAEVAVLVSLLLNAVDFAKKLTNLSTFDMHAE